MVTGDLQQCVKEYGDLIAQYPADAIAHNNRAMCLSKLRHMREAVDEVRQAIQILPKRVSLRANLSIYADYAGDFQAATREVEALQEPTDLTTLAVAFAKLGQGLIPEATATYQKLGTVGPRGPSWAASGVGDLALYEGRFSDAVRIFEQGADADLARKSADKAARKFSSLAYAHLMRGQKSAANAAAEKALLMSKTVPVRFLAARVFVEAGALTRARTEAARISLGTFVNVGQTDISGNTASARNSVEAEAYAKIVEAEIALKTENSREAIKLLTEANTLADSWLGHFDLGLAFLKVPVFAQAEAEFDKCLKRRGEAMSILVDEEPTYGLFPPVFYYQGLAREGLHRPEFAESFRAYTELRGKSTEDPLMQEIRRHSRR
jgi:tetratricopeptide (TPR) repeat protein